MNVRPIEFLYSRPDIPIRGRAADGSIMYARVVGKSLARRIREEKEAERLRAWMVAKGAQQKSE